MRGLRMLAECDDAPHLVGNLRRLFVLTDDSKEGTGPDELASDTFATNALTGETHDELCDALRTVLLERLAVASRAHARKYAAVGD